MASTSRVINTCKSLLAAAKSPIPATAAASKKPSTSKPSPATEKKKKTTGATSSVMNLVKPPIFRKPAGIFKAQPVSPVLRNFLGVDESARTTAVMKIWYYIRDHNLQNPENRREILCDDELKKIYEGREKLSFPEISKFLTPHFVKN